MRPKNLASGSAMIALASAFLATACATGGGEHNVICVFEVVDGDGEVLETHVDTVPGLESMQSVRCLLRLYGDSVAGDPTPEGMRFYLDSVAGDGRPD